MKRTQIFLFSITLLLIKIQVYGQNSYLMNYEWEKSPTIHELTEYESTLDQVYIKHQVVNEIIYLNDESAIEYYMEHVIKHVVSDEAIDGNNKVYLPGTEASKEDYTIVEKARVIKSNGDVIYLDEDEILEEKNEEEGKTYRFFALDNVQAGDEVEYYYVYPKKINTSGIIYKMQSSIFKREATVINITPKNLINEFKSFNGFPEMTKDSSIEDYNHYQATMTNVPILREEKYADHSAHTAAVEYHLKENTLGSYHSDYYNSVSKYLAEIVGNQEGNTKSSKKLLKKIKLDSDATTENKIRSIENYIKREVFYIDGVASTDDVFSAVTGKVANRNTLIKIYANLFQYLEIPFEIVYTCDRKELHFHPEYESGIYLRDVLFYFPEEEQYLSPTSSTSRYGFPPSELTENNGYFTRMIKIGEMTAGMGKIKRIPAVPYEKSVDRFTLEVSLENLPIAEGTLDRTQTGYNALTMQYILDKLDEENREDVKKSFTEYIDEDMDIQEYEVVNSSIEDFPSKPLQVNSTFTTSSFVQKAGNKYLLNIGKMIGPQAELYQEEERKLPVSNYFNKLYDRTIKIKIPIGYRAENLDSLNMNITYEKDGKKDIGFISTYTLEGNILTVKCEEYYTKLYYPVDEYPKFESVINAAADFNKKAIVLVKE